MFESQLPSSRDPYSDTGDEEGQDEPDGSADQDDRRLVGVGDGRKRSDGAGHEGAVER